MEKFFKSGERGFTLIELLVVIAILGILSGIAIPNLSGFIGEGKNEAASTEFHNVQLAMNAGMIDNNITSVTDGWGCWTNDLSGKPGEFDLADYLSSTDTEFYYKWTTDGTILQDEDGL